MRATNVIFTVLFLFFSIGISTNLSGQNDLLYQRAKKFAEEISSQMAKDLRLTAEEQNAVYQALFERNVRGRKITTNKELTTEQKKEKRKENSLKYREDLQEKFPKDLVTKILRWERDYSEKIKQEKS